MVAMVNGETQESNTIYNTHAHTHIEVEAGSLSSYLKQKAQYQASTMLQYVKQSSDS